MPLRHVSDGADKELLALEVQHGGPHLDLHLGTGGPVADTQQGFGSGITDLRKVSSDSLPIPLGEEREEVLATCPTAPVTEQRPEGRAGKDDPQVAVQNEDPVGQSRRGQDVER